MKSDIKKIQTKFNDKLENLNLFTIPDQNLCSNPIYKTIVTLILCGILLYLIWYLCKKQYQDDKIQMQMQIEISTPFN